MEKIRKIKKLIKKNRIDAYLIPKNDIFFNEYINKKNDNLNYISNFSGSSGFAIITKYENYLFVDGRYTLQARYESGENFKILEIPKIIPKTYFKKKLKLGFDPKLHTEKSLQLFFGKKKFDMININKNLIDEIKIGKRDINKNKFFILPKSIVGLETKKKIALVVANLKKEKSELQIITSSDNISWLLNIRGKDTEFVPTTNCFLILDKYSNIFLFVDQSKLNNKIKKQLKFVTIINIQHIYNFLKSIKKKKIMVDSLTCTLYFLDILKKNNNVKQKLDYIYFLKSRKNKIEKENIKKTHIIDGVALTKFIFWLKKNFKKKKIDEINAQNKLLQFRKRSKKFKFLSFPTISASGPNGAIIHYRVNNKTNRRLRRGDIYLIDSGGQYNFGTTDVTRTLSLDNTNERVKDIFTRVLKGHIAVSNYNLKKNTIGSDVDKVARKYLKLINLDYDHGTGHGVGYFLNVHELPFSISKKSKNKFEDGVVLSNEPGYYEKNKFGIRIENLIIVSRKNKKLFFEDLTLVPIDKNLIKKELLNLNEINWINKYHEKVYKNLINYMNKDEKRDLKNSCSKI